MFRCDFTFIDDCSDYLNFQKTHPPAILAETNAWIVGLMIAFEAFPVVGGPQLQINAAVGVLTCVGKNKFVAVVIAHQGRVVSHERVELEAARSSYFKSEVLNRKKKCVDRWLSSRDGI
jgi:hypothetical protein